MVDPSEAEITTLAQRLFAEHAGRVRVAEQPLDDPPDFLHAEEREAIAHAVLKRRREFATGRRMAHELLGRLGLDAGPLLAGKNRAPLWPAGSTGSISHGAGGCVVAVANTADVRALGVDIEGSDALPERLWRMVLRDAEREHVEAAGAEAGLWAKLVFSAKETTYKALAADVGRVLEFREVEIELEPAAGRFRATLLAPEREVLAPEALSGRLLMGAGRVVTALLR